MMNDTFMYHKAPVTNPINFRFRNEIFVLKSNIDRPCNHRLFT